MLHLDITSLSICKMKGLKHGEGRDGICLL